jgi:hypothetical protein
MIILVSPVLSTDTWEKESSNGSWLIETNSHWKSAEDQNFANLTFKYHPSGNFSIWDTRIKGKNSITGLGLMLQWIDLSIGNDTEYLQVEICYSYEAWAWFFGLLQGTVTSSSVRVSKISNHTDYDQVGSWGMFPVYRIVFLRFNATMIRLKVLAFADENSTNAMWNFDRNYTIPENAYNYPQVYLEQDIAKDFVVFINGYIEGWKFQELLECNGAYHEDWETEGTLGFWDSILTELWGGLTSAWNGLTSWTSEHLAFLGDVYSYLAFGLNFIVNLFQTATQFFPLFIMGYGIFLLGLIIVCVIEGDPAPLWDHLLFLYQVLANVISMIMNVAEVIYNFVHIW